MNNKYIESIRAISEDQQPSPEMVEEFDQRLLQALSDMLNSRRSNTMEGVSNSLTDQKTN